MFQQFVSVFAFFGLTLSEYSFPLYTDPFGDLMLEIEIPLHNVSTFMKLDFGISEAVPFSPITDHDTPLVFFIPSDILPYTFSSRFVSFIDDTGEEFTTEGSGLLSVSPHGELVRASGYIAVIKDTLNSNRANLIVESSFESFSSSCFPNSLMRVNFTVDDRVDGFVAMGGERIEVGFVWFRSNDVRELAGIPRNMFYRISNAIENTGATVRLSDWRRFSNCSQSIFSSLPEIHIHILNDNLDFGRLVLYPDEYLELLPDGGCALRMDYDDRNPIWIDPLRLNGINIRVSRNNSFEICESI